MLLWGVLGGETDCRLPAFCMFCIFSFFLLSYIYNGNVSGSYVGTGWLLLFSFSSCCVYIYMCVFVCVVLGYLVVGRLLLLSVLMFLYQALLFFIFIVIACCSGCYSGVLASKSSDLPASPEFHSFIASLAVIVSVFLLCLCFELCSYLYLLSSLVLLVQSLSLPFCVHVVVFHVLHGCLASVLSYVHVALDAVLVQEAVEIVNKKRVKEGSSHANDLAQHDWATIVSRSCAGSRR